MIKRMRLAHKNRITQLITQLFEFTIQSSANETQVIDLDNYQEYQTSFPQPSHGSPLTDLNASDDEFMMVLGQAGPMAR